MVTFYIGYLCKSVKEYDTCDCDLYVPLQLLENMNGQMLEDNLRLKNELNIALDYINYTNMGNTYYDISMYNIGNNGGLSILEKDDKLSFAYSKFIVDFYEMKGPFYRSVMELMESKKILYKQYIELKNLCWL